MWQYTSITTHYMCRNTYPTFSMKTLRLIGKTITFRMVRARNSFFTTELFSSKTEAYSGIGSFKVGGAKRRAWRS